MVAAEVEPRVVVSAAVVSMVVLSTDVVPSVLISVKSIVCSIVVQQQTLRQA